MAVKVLEPRNLSLNGVDYLLTRRMQRQVVNQFPPKIQIGDTSRADEGPLSSWSITNLAGGVGIENMIEGQHVDRFYDSYGVWTLDSNKMHLGALSTSFLPDVLQAVPHKMLMYKDKIYVGNGTGTGNGYVERYNTSTTSFDQVLTVSGAAFTDMVDWTDSAATQKIYACNKHGNLYSSTSGDSGSWSAVTGGGTACHMTVFDTKLIVVGDSIIKYSTDGATFTTFLTHNKGRPTALKTMRHPDTREEIIVISWPDGVYWVDFWTARMYKILDLSPQYEDAGKNMLVHHDDLYVPVQHLLLKMSGSVVSSIGLRKAGDVWPYDSRITCLAAFGDYILAGADDRLMIWNGRGWHVAAYVISFNVRTILVHGQVLTTDDTVRIYWSGDTKYVYYIDLPATGLRPSDYSSFSYEASGLLTTPHFDAGFPEWNKVATVVEATCSGMSATEYISISYRKDGAIAGGIPTFTSLGDPAASYRITADGTTKLYFPTLASKVGLSFRKLQLRASFTRGTTVTNTPNLEALTLRFYRATNVLHAWRAEVDCSKPYKGRTPAEMIAAVDAAVASETMMIMSYCPDDDKLVKVMTMVGDEEGGRKRVGHYILTLMEMD